MRQSQIDLGLLHKRNKRVRSERLGRKQVKYISRADSRLPTILERNDSIRFGLNAWYRAEKTA